jgi:uncharacterized coiled-coil DUF342 family protein
MKTCSNEHGKITFEEDCPGCEIVRRFMEIDETIDELRTEIADLEEELEDLEEGLEELENPS